MSSLPAATGIYSFFRNYAAASLPEPYTGKFYEFYLECLNGNEYIKLVNYDSLSSNQRLSLLKELLPKPIPAKKEDLSTLLPEKRVPESEVLFNGPIALKNFCPLGRRNFFGVGKKARAYGCLVERDGRHCKWVTLTGDSAQFAQARERFLAFQQKNEYIVRKREGYDFLEDQLSGKHMVMVNADDRIYLIFEIDSEKEAIELIRGIQ